MDSKAEPRLPDVAVRRRLLVACSKVPCGGGEKWLITYPVTSCQSDGGRRRSDEVGRASPDGGRAGKSHQQQNKA